MSPLVGGGVGWILRRRRAQEYSVAQADLSRCLPNPSGRCEERFHDWRHHEERWESGGAFDRG